MVKDMGGIDMSIDEAIAHEREMAAIQRNNDKLNKTLGVISPYYKTDCIKCAEEHEQLAEWLEELKDYRDKNKMVVRVDCENIDSIKDKIEELSRYAENQYNKAIDDFVKFANTMPTVEEEDGEIRPMWLEEMAEQLKAGERE